MNIQSWAFTALKVSIFGVILVHIGTEHGKMLRNSPYSIRMRENVDQKSAEYGDFLRSAFYLISQTSFPLAVTTWLRNTNRASGVFRCHFCS